MTQATKRRKQKATILPSLFRPQQICRNDYAVLTYELIQLTTTILKSIITIFIYVQRVQQQRHTIQFTLPIPLFDSLPLSGATDADSPPDRITFQINNSDNNNNNDCGEIFLSSRPNRAVRRFSQADLEAGRVGFRHTGTILQDVFFFHIETN